MKNFIKIFLSIIITFLLINPISTKALTNTNYYDTTDINTPSKNTAYSSYDYVIDKYNVDIIVNENNTFDVIESITAYFNVTKHGIYRKIPLKNSLTRTDGSTSSNRVLVSNIKVNNVFTTSKNFEYYTVKIGSANTTTTGEHIYIIKYNYNIGKDPLKNIDELYFNIIGDNWDTVIGNITFNITMPKEFDATKLGFSSGIKGSINSDNVNFNVNGLKISGSYNGILNAEEALTVRCELPNNYFVGAGFPIGITDYIMFGVPLISLLIIILLWYKFGRDEQVIETVEFYPPVGFNSLEVGLLYKGRVEQKDVLSLIIYLANKGYIKIVESDKYSLVGKYKDFKIVKLKEYDGNNINEKLFLEGLFTKVIDKYAFMMGQNAEVKKVNESTKDTLRNNFYKTIDKILFNINSKENVSKILEEKATKSNFFVYLMIIISSFAITIPVLYTNENFGILTWFTGALIPIIGLLMTTRNLFDDTTTIFIKTIKLSCFLLLVIMPLIMLIIPSFRQDNTYLIAYVFGFVCIIIMVIFSNIVPKRTPYGKEMLGKIKGFKNFLETAEKDKLESIVAQNPSYFYDILPFTYILGVSDKWIKKFKVIATQSPSWYDSTTPFTVTTFGLFMNSAMTNLTYSAASPGSGTTGGGSSGGGSGGGGGGSW